MKKNNKGFFLAETIVVIALVTTVMAFVYPNVTKLYDNYKNRTNYYDQIEDLYALKVVYDLLENENINFVDPAKPKSEVKDTDVIRVNALGFLTYKKYSLDGKHGIGCLDFGDNIFKIYDSSKSIGIGLDEIRKKNNDGNNINNNDFFTCVSSYVEKGVGVEEHLDFSTSGSGRKCNITKEKYARILKEMHLTELYIAGYMDKPSSDNYNFNKYLKRLKKTTYDKDSYRLIGVFNNERYASIRIDNPNPNGSCPGR